MLLHEIANKNKYLDYHDSLSDKLWVGKSLKPEVRNALLRIAEEFIETLKVSENQISDIIITGSMCNFNYTKYSDIDLHIELDYSVVCDDCQTFDLDDCMKAKKSLWNEQHDITIYDIPVEVYVNDISEKHTGNAGVYSLLHDMWINKPTKIDNMSYSESEIMSKAKPIMYEIDEIIDNKVSDTTSIQKLKDKIKRMRKAGLERGGEFGVENLVFKVLRNSGYMEKLYNYALSAADNNLSLE